MSDTIQSAIKLLEEMGGGYGGYGDTGTSSFSAPDAGGSEPYDAVSANRDDQSPESAEREDGNEALQLLRQMVELLGQIASKDQVDGADDLPPEEPDLDAEEPTLDDPEATPTHHEIPQNRHMEER